MRECLAQIGCTEAEFVEECDPDWKDHFHNVEMAFDYYSKWMSENEILDVIMRMG